MIPGLIGLLISLLIIGIIIWLALYIVSVLPLAAPFGQVARVIIIVIGCLVLIMLLSQFAGIGGVGVHLR